MVDLLAQGVAWLDGIRQSHMSQGVFYCRGNDCVEIVATMGATTYETVDESGAIVGATSVDFIVTAEALILDSGITIPMVGDQFRFLAGWGSFRNEIPVFEVLDLNGASHYRLVGPQEVMMRIHTKRVADMEFV